jgi:hypothetical protein
MDGEKPEIASLEPEAKSTFRSNTPSALSSARR